MVMEAFESAGLVDAETMNLKSFRIDLKDMSEPFYGRSLKTISAKDVYDQVMRLIFKYRIHMPRNLLLLLKTFIQTEALGKILGSDASLLEVTRPYARKLLEQGYEAQKLIKNIGRDVKNTGSYLRMIPKLSHDIFKGLAKGPPRVEVEHGGLDQAFKKFENGLNRLTLGHIGVPDRRVADPQLFENLTDLRIRAVRPAQPLGYRSAGHDRLHHRHLAWSLAGVFHYPLGEIVGVSALLQMPHISPGLDHPIGAIAERAVENDVEAGIGADKARRLVQG